MLGLYCEKFCCYTMQCLTTEVLVDLVVAMVVFFLSSKGSSFLTRSVSSEVILGSSAHGLVIRLCFVLLGGYQKVWFSLLRKREQRI